MSAKAILKRLADIKASVSKRAGFDKKNIADELRSPGATQVMKDTKQAQIKVFGTEADPQQDPDLNKKSSAVSADLTFESKEAGPQAQLLSVQIKDGASLSVKVKDGSEGKLVVITIEEGTTTNEEIKDAVEASRADALMSCSIASGQETELAAVSEILELKGGA